MLSYSIKKLSVSIVLAILVCLPFITIAVAAPENAQSTKNGMSLCEQFFNFGPSAKLVLVCVIYFAIILIGRYFWLVLLNNRYLWAYAEEIRAQLRIEQKNPAQQTDIENNIIPRIKKLLDQLEEMVPKDPKWYQWLLGGAGKQMAGWRHVHRAKIFATDLYSDEDACAQAIVTMKQLEASQSSIGKEFAKKLAKLDEDVKLELPIQKAPNPPPPLNIPMIKSLTKQGQDLYFEERDNYFEGLAGLQNRITWLVIVSLLIIVLLGFTSGHHIILFLLGAVGGLLSRMRSILDSREKAFDYGASWSSLFLSPVTGAITAWTGILLTFALTKLDILGPALNSVFGLTAKNTTTWGTLTISAEVMALAVVFGYSATLFENIVRKVEEKVTSGPPTSNKK